MKDREDENPMAGTLERPLSVEERLQKAKALLRQGIEDFEAAERAEGELGIRRRGALACETAFHALVELTDVLIERSGHAAVDNHDRRIEALEDIGRLDLANLYERAMTALHISGDYGQRVGRRQSDRLRELRQVVERELQKLT